MNGLINDSVALAVMLVPFINAVVELVKVTDLDKKFYPHVSAVVGLLMGITLSILNSDITYVLTGVIAGFSASGLYDHFGAMDDFKKIK